MAKKKREFKTIESCFCADRKRMILNLNQYIDNLRRVLRDYGDTMPYCVLLEMWSDYTNAVSMITRLYTHLYNIEVLGNPVKPVTKLPQSYISLDLWL